MNHSSKRFTPSAWMEKLIPVFLTVLALALLLTLIVIGLSLFGLTPA